MGSFEATTTLTNTAWICSSELLDKLEIAVSSKIISDAESHHIRLFNPFAVFLPDMSFWRLIVIVFLCSWRMNVEVPLPPL